MLLMGGLGWAKPVPFNPYALKFRWGGTLLIALSGPTMNMFQALISAVMMRTLVGVEFPPEHLVIQFLSFYLTINVILGVFNLIPIPPLDGARALLSLFPDRYEEWKVKAERIGPFFLIWFVLMDAWSGLHAFSWLLDQTSLFIAQLLYL